MQVSYNNIRKYLDLPQNLTDEQMSYDLTMRTVEVEHVVKTGDKFKNIVVGLITSVSPHPNADRLRVCKVNIGGSEDVQIVCGGSNLYAGEKVVISLPGSKVYWHGEDSLVEIKETKMRGEFSYGMICGATEVYLENYFPPKDESEIVDLTEYDVEPGTNIADFLKANDTVLEIDNKSLTNRPDLWGVKGIARELGAIYKLPLKEEELIKPNVSKSFDIEIEDSIKCPRYAAIEIEGVNTKSSPLWMQTALINSGMRPINAIVDITNYVMIMTGQPTHAFDRTHVAGDKIIVRNAKSEEKLLLLDGNEVSLDTEDLVISDTEEALALAGIKGGRKDSILDTTTSVLIEVANFNSTTIRNTDKKVEEKTDAAIRYEKGIDTQRVDEGISLILKLFNEIFPESKVTAFNDVNLNPTKENIITVSEDFLNNRLGKVIDSEVIIDLLSRIGYIVEFNNNIYTVTVPTYRSTGDVTIKDDVMGDIARLLGYDYFESKPLTISFEKSVKQNKVTLERRIKEFLASRCGFNEIFTYPWIDEKYINACKVDIDSSVKLETPPSPELGILRSSLIPASLEVVSKNLRYFHEMRIFEMAQVFTKGIYHPSTEEETLPIHKKLITGSIVGKDAKKIFFDVKGVLENLSSFNHMENISFKQEQEVPYLDKEAYLNITLNDEIIGSMGLVKPSVLKECGIKRVSVCTFEIDFDKLIPFESRTNTFTHLPEFPLVEKDLALLCDKEVTWESITNIISKMVNTVEFIEEYNGEKIPENKKSITLRVKFGKEDGTLTTEEINSKINAILKRLNKELNITLREE